MAKKRLIKVAKELNVGISTIVDHLKSNGFDLESKPTAQVTDEMYAELNKEFKSSIAIKEKADQLIIGTRPIAKREKDPVKMPPIPKPKIVASPPPPPPVIRRKEEPVVAKKATPSPPKAPKTVPVPETTPTSKTSSTPGKLKILGKIDLDRRTSSGKYKKPTVEQKTPTPPTSKVEKPKAPVAPPKVEQKVQTPSVKVEKPKEVAPVVKAKEEEKTAQKPQVTSPVVTEKTKVVAPVKVKESLPKAEPKEVKAPSEAKQTKVEPTSPSPKKEEKPVEKLVPETKSESVKKQKKEAKKVEKKEERREQKAKTSPKPDRHQKSKQDKNKKSKSDKIKPNKQEEAKTGEKAPKEASSTPTPVQNTMVRAETPELRGLKIVGKIDTNQFKRKRKKRRRDDKKDDNRAKVNKDDTKSSEDKDKKEDGENRRKRRRTRKKVLTEGSSNQSGRNRDSNNRSGDRTGDDRNNRGGERTRTVRPGSGERGTSRTGGGTDRGTSRTGGGTDRGTSRTGGGTSRTGGGGDRTRTSRTGGGGNRGGNNRGGERSRRTRDRNHRGRSDRGRRDEVKEVSQKEIDDKIKATMARISGRGNKKRSRVRRENRERIRDKQELREQEKTTDKLQVTEFISVSELASLMDVAVTDVIMTCMNLGVIVSINQRLDAEIIELVGEEYGHEVEFISVEEHVDEEEEIIDDPADLRPRSPIVTVMGHVDHGKTSLLDYIRDANVADGEAGGITQHIGAYEVKVGEEKKPITFLDTPGHEAFTAMRARGAKVTDIAVIIISADDSIMPQTKEAISHAQAASVPMVFAINKIDKDGAQPERIKQELASMNLMVEDWGGKYQSQDISAKTGLNIDLLLEKILLEAELLELKANPSRAAIGAVLEASLDKGRGYVAKTLVQTGTLKIGDPIVAGEHSGKVKAMFNERGKRVKKAGPSTPVLVLGLGGAPQAGELFKVVDSEQEARSIASKRAQIAREQANRATKRISLDELGRRIALGTFKELNLIVKGDVDGSIEALSDSLIKLSVETVQVNVIHKAVGQIIESDVLLASASDAIIIGFQVRPSLGARKLAEREGVEINTYSVIYDVIDEIKTAMEGMLEPTKEKKVTGNVEIREVYKISKIGNIAGCYVLDGKISRNSHVSVIRDGIVKYPVKEGAHGELASLKRYKDDVKEVKFGMECGLTIKNFNDIKVGDIVEAYDIIEIKQTLSSQKKR